MAAAASAKTLDHALSDSGIVYIPTFALGRTQERIYELDRINPGVPVFIDSPLGIRITRLYQDMDDCWDKEA
ncbi:MAG: MBL fold metallo-hydrolase, partial [Desulfobacteraceae bacterium]|nr:MBL fold metallo-hydrolase [Desulfobacteraceae bacterium]